MKKILFLMVLIVNFVQGASSSAVAFKRILGQEEGEALKQIKSQYFAFKEALLNKNQKAIIEAIHYPSCLLFEGSDRTYIVAQLSRRLDPFLETHEFKYQIDVQEGFWKSFTKEYYSKIMKFPQNKKYKNYLSFEVFKERVGVRVKVVETNLKTGHDVYTVFDRRNNKWKINWVTYATDYGDGCSWQ